MTVSIIGLDIAKSTFHAVGVSRGGKEQLRKQFSRGRLLRWFAQQERCLVAMEACSGAHHWGRELRKLGFEVALVPARVVKTLVTGAKNDYNDARAIAKAATLSDVHWIPVKTIEQHELQVLHVGREAAKKERTAASSRIRGVLSEYGLVIAQGLGALRRRLPELLEDAENGLGVEARAVLAEFLDDVRRLDQRIGAYDRKLRQVQRQHPDAKRLSEIPGFGPVLASALVAHLGNARQFANGRALAASLGIVPHQLSTGGKARLVGISKRGNSYLRAALVNGARSVLNRADSHDDPLRRWARGLQARRAHNIATVAIANKLARIAWVVLARGAHYDPNHA